MSSQETRKANQLFDDYITAYFAGNEPRADDYLARCPKSEYGRLAEAIEGFLYSYDNYFTSHISEDAVVSALERLQRIRRRKQVIADAETRARAVSWEQGVTDPLQQLTRLLYPMATGQSAQQVAVLNRPTATVADSTTRMTAYEKRAAEQFAQRESERMLLRAGVESYPVSLDAIAAQLCLLVRETPLKEFEGRLLTDGDTGGILLNSLTTDRRRRRFTFAHEIAHFVLHRGTQHLFNDNESQLYSTTSQLEFEASSFASSLLMPPSLLPKWFGREIPRYNHAEQIVNDFDVSLMAVLRRLVQVSNYRTYFLSIEGDQVKWFDFSPEVTGFNRLVTRLSTDTAAGELNADSRCDTLRYEVSARSWFERGDLVAEDAVIIEESHRFNSGHIYTLLTVKE